MADKIKIFVSTKKTQGRRKNDFCHLPEGEPLRIMSICDECYDINPSKNLCVCSRSLMGLYSCERTTTFKVAQSNMTAEEYINAYINNDSLYCQMCVNAVLLDVNHECIEEMRELLKREAEDIIKFAEGINEDDVLERRFDDFKVRMFKDLKALRRMKKM
jgi:hypothetical protein